jgi:UDP-N-acetylglucosamine--dolichyl-phosphate N-acetylglucosaminephosphotransferase
MTYFIGTLIAIMAIFGNIEKFALIIFIPYFIEFFLKFRGKMQKESFGKVLPDGSLSMPYRRYYGLEHMMIAFLRRVSGKALEWQVTVLILLVEATFAVWALTLYHM